MAPQHSMFMQWTKSGIYIDQRYDSGSITGIEEKIGFGRRITLKRELRNIFVEYISL